MSLVDPNWNILWSEKKKLQIHKMLWVVPPPHLLASQAHCFFDKGNINGNKQLFIPTHQIHPPVAHPSHSYYFFNHLI